MTTVVIIPSVYVNVCFPDRDPYEPGGHRGPPGGGGGTSGPAPEPNELGDPREPNKECHSDATSTGDFLRACAAGSGKACAQLESANLTDLKYAVDLLARTRPDLVNHAEKLPKISFDYSLDFYNVRAGETAVSTGNVTLTGGFRDRAYFVETFSEELLHQRHGYLGRLGDFWKDVFGAKSDHHEQIDQESRAIADSCN